MVECRHLTRRWKEHSGDDFLSRTCHLCISTSHSLSFPMLPQPTLSVPHFILHESSIWLSHLLTPSFQCMRFTSVYRLFCLSFTRLSLLPSKSATLFVIQRRDARRGSFFTFICTMSSTILTRETRPEWVDDILVFLYAAVGIDQDVIERQKADP